MSIKKEGLKPDALWKIYDVVNEWIRFCDAKAIAILGIDGLVATIIFSNVEELKTILLLNPYKLFFIIGGSIAYFLSVFFAVKCLRPRIKTSTDSLIFFGTISDKKLEDYDREVKEILEKNEILLAQIISQIHTNSNIASVKYREVNRAICSFITTIVIFLIFGLINLIV